MKLFTISIMAHPKRKKYVEELLLKLGDVPVAWDSDNTIWNTCKKAWRLAGDSKWHLVIQDDAILSKNFLQDVEKHILQADKEADSIQFYVGKNFERNYTSEIEKGYVVKKFFQWGVAVALRTKEIEEMIAFGDNWKQNWQDDSKIKQWLISKKYKTYFPVPCLVQHRREDEEASLVGNNTDRFSTCFIDDYQQIPRIIHQIWIGDKSKRPKEIMETWKMKDWEYKLWREEDIEKLNLKNKKAYDYYYARKDYAGASDVVRIEILAKYGGVYIDADTERLESIDELLEHCDFFAVEANKPAGITDGGQRIANGIVGSSARHPILLRYITKIGALKKYEPAWNTVGGTLLTRMIRYYRTPFTKILEPHTFYPFDSKGNPSRTKGKVYARHFWGSTHNSY